MIYKFKSPLHLLSLCGLFLMLNGCNTPKGQDKQAETGTDNGFVQLFNGETLEGWEGDTSLWRVENGNLVGEITPETLLEQNSFIIWQGGEPGNFEFKAEYKISESGNSGINYRSVKLGNIPYALKGYQADIDGANNYTGQNYEERGRTTLAYRGQKVSIPTVADPSQSSIKNNAWTAAEVTGSLGDTDSLKVNMNDNDWNEIHIIADGNRLQHYINGVLMSDVTDNDTLNRKLSGFLGMQVHVGHPMKVEYRNIRLKGIK